MTTEQLSQLANLPHHVLVSIDAACRKTKQEKKLRVVKRKGNIVMVAKTTK